MVKRLEFLDGKWPVEAVCVGDLSLVDSSHWFGRLFVDSDGIYAELGPLEGRVRVFPSDWIVNFDSHFVKIPGKVVRNFFKITEKT